jgi:hypothetical protein
MMRFAGRKYRKKWDIQDQTCDERIEAFIMWHTMLFFEK